MSNYNVDGSLNALIDTKTNMGGKSFLSGLSVNTNAYEGPLFYGDQFTMLMS